MRSKHEGNLRLRPDGRWMGQVALAGRRFTVYGATKVEASRKLAGLRASHTHGTLVVPSKLTLGAFLVDQWLPYVERTRKPSTARHYRQSVRAHLEPQLGAIPVQKLAPLHIVALQERLGARRRASYAQEVLSAALEDARRWGLVSQNAARQVQRLKQRRTEQTPWTVDETRRFVETAFRSDLRYAPAVALKLALGLRTAELFGLRWADIDRARQQATICQTYTWSYGAPTLGDPKSYAGLRTLALNSVALRALELQASLRSNEYVVATLTGRVPNPSNLRETLDKLCRQAEVPRVTLHQLRHQCASLLIALGADVKQVQHYMGHSTASVTLNIYAHLLGQGNAELAAHLGRLLDGG